MKRTRLTGYVNTKGRKLMKKVIFWQTVGGSVEVPDDQVSAFEQAVGDNDVEAFPEIMETFSASWYEGEVVEVR